MKKTYSALIVGVVISTTTGCASQPPAHIASWIERIDKSYVEKLSKQDISRMLNAAPYKCEEDSIEGKTGFSIKRSTGLVIDEVDPSGPAVNTGIKAGDKLISINSKVIKTDHDYAVALGEMDKAGPETSHVIETQRGSYKIKLKYPKHSETCYWESNMGRVSSFSGSTYVNQYAGSGYAAGSSRETFFRLNCGLDDGVTYGVCTYQAQW